MLKTIETTNKVIIQKMAQFPVDIAAEVLTCYCNNKGPNAQCVLLGTDYEKACPFVDFDCMDITVDMWEEYFNA